MIAAAGGKSVVAHLPTLGKTWLTKFGDKLEALRDGGLWGVEYVCNWCCHPTLQCHSVTSSMCVCLCVCFGCRCYSSEISEEAHEAIAGAVTPQPRSSAVITVCVGVFAHSNRAVCFWFVLLTQALRASLVCSAPAAATPTALSSPTPAWVTCGGATQLMARRQRTRVPCSGMRMVTRLAPRCAERSLNGGCVCVCGWHCRPFLKQHTVHHQVKPFHALLHPRLLLSQLLLQQPCTSGPSGDTCSSRLSVSRYWWSGV